MYSSAIIHKIIYFPPNPAIFYNNVNIFKKGAASHSSAFLLYGNHVPIYSLKTFRKIRLISALPEPLPYGSLCS